MPLPPPGKKISDMNADRANRTDVEELIANCTRAIEIDSRDFKAYFQRAVAFQRKGDYAQAVKDFDAALEIHPKFMEGLKQRGICYLALGHPTYAINDFEKMIRIDPKSADAYNLIGEGYARMSQYDEAIKNYSRAIEIDPQHWQAYYNRGETYVARGQYPAACYNKGYSYYHQGMLERALNEFNAGIKADPEFEFSYLGKAQALEAMGLRSEAIAEYHNLIKTSKNQTSWHIEYARRLLNQLLSK